MDFDKLTKKFLLGEWKTDVSVLSRTRAIRDVLENLKTRSLKDKQNITMALENLNRVRKDYRKLEKQNEVLLKENMELNERLQILEENKGS
jgi:uncharacterized protein (DUF3084 family)